MVEFTDESQGGGAGRLPEIGGKLAASVFFLFFFGMGSVFCVLLMTAVGRAASQQMWKSVPCKIITSEVQDRSDNDRPVAFAVSYAYEYGGQSYSGSIYQRNYKASATHSEAQRLSEKYPAGRTSTCCVNPKDPADAVLKRDSLMLGLFIVIPLVFVCIGAGGLYVTWRPKREKTESLAGRARQSGFKGKYLPVGFCAIFSLVGLGMTHPPKLGPLTELGFPCRGIWNDRRNQDEETIQ